MSKILQVRNLSKQFTLHNQGGAHLRVLGQVDLSVSSGDCVVLHGPSGAGKSTLLRMLYGNYKPSSGHVFVRHRNQMIDIASASARDVLDVRRRTMSWVSQFLRVIPRISTIDLVAEPLLARGLDNDGATDRAARMLERLNIPERLWRLAPATFSGGEQQRVNIARSFVAITPLMLLDEPTASLDSGNRDVVINLISEARERGAAIVGIFHDTEVRERVATHHMDITRYQTAEAA